MEYYINKYGNYRDEVSCRLKEYFEDLQGFMEKPNPEDLTKKIGEVETYLESEEFTASASFEQKHDGEFLLKEFRARMRKH